MTAAWAAVRAGDTHRAAALASPLGYDVVQLLDATTGMQHVVLESSSAAHPSPPAGRGWGMFVWTPSGDPNLTVEAPHPWDDEHSDAIATRLFQTARAGALLIAGASRFSVPGGAADMAHVSSSVFDALHRADLSPVATVVQAHGFAHEKHPGYGEVVVSEGAAPRDIGRRAHVALRGAGFDARLYDGASYGQLAATRNVQGISTRAAGGQFLHVEAGGAIRYDTSRRQQLADAIAAATAHP